MSKQSIKMGGLRFSASSSASWTSDHHSFRNVPTPLYAVLVYMPTAIKFKVKILLKLQHKLTTKKLFIYQPRISKIYRIYMPSWYAICTECSWMSCTFTKVNEAYLYDQQSLLKHVQLVRGIKLNPSQHFVLSYLVICYWFHYTFALYLLYIP